MIYETEGLKEEIEKWKKFTNVLSDEIEKEAKTLGKEWLVRLRKGTPVGKTKQLRPGWKVKVNRDESIEIEAYNNVKYAPHWNYGHRVKVHGKYTGKVVKGTYLVERSRQEVYRKVPNALKNAIKRTKEKVGD